MTKCINTGKHIWRTVLSSLLRGCQYSTIQTRKKKKTICLVWVSVQWFISQRALLTRTQQLNRIRNQHRKPLSQQQGGRCGSILRVCLTETAVTSISVNNNKTAVETRESCPLGNCNEHKQEGWRNIRKWLPLGQDGMTGCVYVCLLFMYAKPCAYCIHFL